MIIEATLEQMRKSYDWSEVFAAAGVESGVNGGLPAREGGTKGDAFGFDDVAAVLASANGENDVASWICIVLLRNGKFAALEGSCDCTGWDCQSGANAYVADTLADVIRIGVSANEHHRLGVTTA